MADQIPSISIYENSGEEIIKRFFSKYEVVVLVGSKISEWPNTNLPSGTNVTMQIASLMGDVYPNKDQKNTIVKYIIGSPFEYILDQCPRMDLLRPYFRKLFGISESNSVHRAIANLVTKGEIHSIITPNYDMCFESLISDGSPLTHVVTKNDSKGLNKSSRVLFKIHGTAQKKYQDTMVLQLSQEGLLDIWKQDLLQKLLEGRGLLTLGFSGLDFEISPHLLASGYDKLVWNSRKDPNNHDDVLSPNANRLLNESNGEIIWGDLKLILSTLGESIALPSNGNSPRDIGKEIKLMLTDEELLLWASSILASPGYARFAEKYAITLQERTLPNSVTYAKAVRLEAAATYSKGRYSFAAERAIKASKMFSSLNLFEENIFSQALAIDSLRCNGRIEVAKKLLLAVRQSVANSNSQLKGRLKAKIDLQELLILREEYERAKIRSRFRVPKQLDKAREIQRRAKSLMASVVDVSEKNGQWHDIQQCRMWAGRLDFNFREVYSGPLKPLENFYGWKHLGHIVQQMMSLRDSLYEKRLAEAPEKQVREYIEIAEEIHCFPEVWKLTLALWKHYGRKRGDSPIKWLGAFINCDYTPVMRLYKLSSERYR